MGSHILEYKCKDENVLHLLEHIFHIWGFENLHKNVCKYLQHCFDRITLGKESQSNQRLSAQSLIPQHKQSLSIFFPKGKMLIRFLHLTRTHISVPKRS